MEQALQASPWLVGGRYSLADISWGPSITTVASGGFDFGPFPAIRRWYDALCRRPQFDRAVLEWRKQAQWEKLKKVKSSYADQTHG